jgi:Ca2+-binding EF-hand superfamily protein
VSGTDSDVDTSLTGSGKGDLSAQIMGLLMMMQNDPSAAATSASSTSTQSASGTSQDPLSQLVTAIDTNGDGSISQSEMETYIQSQGGTQSQADSLFSALGKNSAGNLTQAQLSNDLQQAGANGASRPHGHHHHHGGPPSADDVASKLVQAMDTNGDGSVDQSEFENFVTSLGGTTSEADTDFAALNTQNSGSITAKQFDDAITSFEAGNQPQSLAGMNTSSPILTLLDAFTKSASTGTTTGVTA